MSQEPTKPKLIIKNPLATPSNGEPLKLPNSSPAAPAGDTDPITRFGNELYRVNETLDMLCSAVHDIYKRGEPATASQVKELLQEAKQGIKFNMNAVAVAQQLAPELKENTKQAVAQIAQATQGAVNQMSHHYNREANRWHATIGFTSWKSAAAILVTTLAIVVGCVWYAATQRERMTVMEARMRKTEGENEFNSKYFNWIDEKYPKVWPIYEAKLDQEAKANSTNK